MCTAFVAKFPDKQDECEILQGFTDSDTTPPTIWIDKAVGDPGILIHEGLHLYSDKRFGEHFREVVDEAATEYFARKILDGINIEHEQSYQERTVEMQALMAKLDDDEPLRQAYFEGNIDALYKAVDGNSARARSTGGGRR